MTKRIRGAFAPVPTPVQPDGNFDPSALRRHLSWLAGEGLAGALILGTNGEFPSFTLAERLRIAETAAGAGAGLQLLLGVGSCALDEVIAMLDVADELGYGGVLCPPPFYFRSAPLDGFVGFFRRVLSAARLPVMLYHIPKVTGVPLSDELLEALSGEPWLAGVKDSTADPVEMDRLLRRFRTGLYMVGSDYLVSRCAEGGGSGSITAAASVVPGLVARVAAEPAAQESLSRVRALLEEYGLGGAVKAILRTMGFGQYGSRPPLTGLPEVRTAELVDRFEQETGRTLSRV